MGVSLGDRDGVWGVQVGELFISTPVFEAFVDVVSAHMEDVLVGVDKALDREVIYDSVMIAFYGGDWKNYKGALKPKGESKC